MRWWIRNCVPWRATCRHGETRCQRRKMVPVQGIGAVRRWTREHEMRAQRFPLPGAIDVGGARRRAAGRQESHDARTDHGRGDDLVARPRRGFWMGRRILAQAGAISAVATQIMRGDLSQRLPMRDTDDEINTLAARSTPCSTRSSNTLGMRTVLDSAAHDLRTPLNRLQATAEGVSRLSPLGRAARSRAVTTEVDHMRSTLDACCELRPCRNRHGGAGTDLSELVARGRTLCPGQRRRGIGPKARRRRGAGAGEPAVVGAGAGDCFGAPLNSRRRRPHPGGAARIRQRTK